MKRVFFSTVLSLALSFAGQAQDLLPSNQDSASLTSLQFEDSSEAKNTRVTEAKIEKIGQIPDVSAGYYLVANTFSRKKSRNRFISEMKQKGLNAQYLTNPEDGLSYVWLKRHDSLASAIVDCDSELDGKYTDDLWILIVEKDIAKDALPGLKDKASKKSYKLLEQADSFFEVMRYAEAAKYYDMALNDNTVYSKEVLQRAGDSYYFNSNMERAYHWYHILYENYEDEISADNLFKYAHALKGNSNYSRAKRIMRLYKKKVTDEDSFKLPRPGRTREAILDSIVETSDKLEIKNLSVNSKYSDFSPAFYGEDQIVFSSAVDSGFIRTRRYKWNNQPFLDLYVSKIDDQTNELRETKKFSKNINSKYHEASVAFSPDGVTMYFTRNNTKSKMVVFGTKKINFLKIYRSKLVDGEWSEPEELPFNSNEFSTGHPALSPDGKKLYFVSDRPGTIGMTDIFYVLVNDDGSFSEPISLGPEINTRGREMFPFINEEKLYFSSDGHVGLGGLDVFEASFSENGLEPAINLGQPVNSPLDDFSYIVREETQEGYFASNRRGGKGDDDIYSFKRLAPEEAVENLNAIAGTITELITGDTMPDALVVLLDDNNRKILETTTDENGVFLFEDLKDNTKYIVKASQKEFFAEELPVATLNNEKVTTDISLKRMKEMIVIENGVKKLKTDMIYFDFDRATIRRDATSELDKLVEVMTEYSNMVIKIESHTDARGSRAYNKSLSDKRAKSTRDYLIANGIDPSRIESAVGYGEEKLLNECDNVSNCSRRRHQENRRSEFIIVSM